MMQWGYCTNVHAGADLEETLAQLDRYAVAVRRHLAPEDAMGIGLWLSAGTARKLVAEARTDALADWLHAAGLEPYTLNGFPFGDFHQTVVKHHVYRPNWLEEARVAYTNILISILDRLLPRGMTGTISTLPLAWGKPDLSHDECMHAAANLRRVARTLSDLEQSAGRRIILCVEPEPGCFIERCDDLVRYYNEYLFRGPDEAHARRHIGVCHDVCHGVVMFEDQKEMLDRYRANGITIGKVQISSAVILPPDADKTLAKAQLAGFVEDRYLHQTMVKRSPTDPGVFYDDLPQALASEPEGGEWRVHFHVPVYLRQCGHLRASQDAILECIAWCQEHHEAVHYEVETYAWNVLPEPLRQPDLALGIANEMRWFEQALADRSPPTGPSHE